MNKLTLNTSKTEVILFSLNISDFGFNFLTKTKFSQQKKTLKLNKTLKKMAHAIRSIYLIRHQIPLNARILLLKSRVLSHLSFSAILFQNLSAKNLKRLNRQINWGINVCFLRKKV